MNSIRQEQSLEKIMLHGLIKAKQEWKNWNRSRVRRRTGQYTEEILDGELAEFSVLESFDKDRLKMLIDKVNVYGADAIEIVWKVENPLH